MKKSKQSASLILIGLTIASVFCYVYLHKIAFETTGQCPSAIHQTFSEEDQINEEASDVVSPAIFLVKRILSLSKIVNQE